MCPKFVYQHQNWPSPDSREIYYCANWIKPVWPNMHPNELICQLMLNLKMSITKGTAV